MLEYGGLFITEVAVEFGFCRKGFQPKELLYRLVKGGIEAVSLTLTRVILHEGGGQVRPISYDGQRHHHFGVEVASGLLTLHACSRVTDNAFKQISYY